MKVKLIIILVPIFIITAIAIIILLVKEKNNSKYEIVEKEDKAEPEICTEKKIKKNNKKNDKPALPHYDEYYMNLKEKITWSAVGMIFVFAIGFIFYRSIIWSFVLSLIGLYYPKVKTKEIIHERKEELLREFKEALYAISASLSAGKSVPVAFKDAYEDLLIIFEDDKAFILDELQFIIRRLDRNETVEESLNEFAERSTLEEVQSFADVFTACTRTGGNLKDVIQNSSVIIGEKIEIKQEIQTLLSGKKFEGRLLTIMPIALVLFLEISAPDFINPIFKASGRIMMTFSLFIIGVAALWVRKIINIEV